MSGAELALRIVKATIEVAAFAFLGQALMAVFAGSLRQQNLIYRAFRVVTDPLTRATRAVMPRFMPDRHMPWIAFGILFWLWVFTIVGILYVRRAAG